MLTRLLFSACLLIPATSPALAETPIQIVHRLTDAIRKGDKAAIAPFYATLKGRPLDLSWIDSLLASPENDFVSPTWCFDSKTNIGAAVVIVGSLKGRNLDLDPCYMVPIAGHWRILPEHTDIEVAHALESESTMKALGELADWFTLRKAALLVEIGKELEAAWKKPTRPTQEEARQHMIGIFSKRDPMGFPTSRTVRQEATEFTAGQLVGRWRHADIEHKLATDLTFRKDGTYIGRVEVNGKANGSFSGKWTLKNNRLNYEYTASSDKNIPVGTKDQDKMIELRRDRYIIENGLGLRETYVRIE